MNEPSGDDIRAATQRSDRHRNGLIA